MELLTINFIWNNNNYSSNKETYLQISFYPLNIWKKIIILKKIKKQEVLVFYK
ncbi:hypothetical protein SRED_002550 [Spiroplasma melliferum]|uniref:Spiroplasmavirus-related protein n=1 Tax=Spiroplasma melliferum TaxID=2134 RepID=A0ABX5U9N5_SPIME|nr:hypothetical protein SRED_002550 [Spiroplasma melliferum]